MLIMPGDDLHHCRRVADGVSQGSGAIQGGGKSDQTVPGNAPIGRFKPHHAAKTGRLPDRMS